MGSCISKCKPKKKPKQEDNSHVQDKLIIISQDPISSIPPKITTMPLENQNLKPLSPPPSSTSSTSSFSSFSCSTNNTKCTNTVSSLSSSSSCSSSSLLLLSQKDRSFSNEYLWSCVKDNPHIIGHKEDKKTVVSDHNKTKQSTQEKPNLKRARANLPTLVRQKSFRKEQSFAALPNRGLRSPSPSRRFNSDNSRNVPTIENNSCRHHKIVSKVNSVSSGLKRESFRASPNRDLKIGRNSSVRKKDTMISQQVSMKIDDHIDVGDIKGMKEMDVVMEDINNPLIALDCFIFL